MWCPTPAPSEVRIAYTTKYAYIFNQVDVFLFIEVHFIGNFHCNTHATLRPLQVVSSTLVIYVNSSGVASSAAYSAYIKGPESSIG